MSISRVTQASAQAATVAISTPNAGDLILVFAHRDGSTSPPTLPSGYTTIDGPTGANTNSARTAYRISDGTETSVPTFTNATSIAVVVLRGWGAIGAFLQSGGNSATMSYGGLTLQDGSGRSWIVGFGGHRTATNVGTNAPTGLTTESSATDVAVFDSEGGKSSWSTQTAGVNATSGYRTETVEIMAPVPGDDDQYNPDAPLIGVRAGLASLALAATMLAAATNLAVGYDQDAPFAPPTIGAASGTTLILSPPANHPTAARSVFLFDAGELPVAAAPTALDDTTWQPPLRIESQNIRPPLVSLQEIVPTPSALAVEDGTLWPVVRPAGPPHLRLLVGTSAPANVPDPAPSTLVDDDPGFAARIPGDPTTTVISPAAWGGANDEFGAFVPLDGDDWAILRPQAIPAAPRVPLWVSEQGEWVTTTGAVALDDSAWHPPILPGVTWLRRPVWADDQQELGTVAPTVVEETEWTLGRSWNLAAPRLAAWTDDAFAPVVILTVLDDGSGFMPPRMQEPVLRRFAPWFFQSDHRATPTVAHSPAQIQRGQRSGHLGQTGSRSVASGDRAISADHDQDTTRSL